MIGEEVIAVYGDAGDGEELFEVQKLVRCKECKYAPICSHSVQHTTHEPTSVTIGYKSVDFCSYGERSSEC